MFSFFDIAFVPQSLGYQPGLAWTPPSPPNGNGLWGVDLWFPSPPPWSIGRPLWSIGPSLWSIGPPFPPPPYGRLAVPGSGFASCLALLVSLSSPVIDLGGFPIQFLFKYDSFRAPGGPGPRQGGRIPLGVRGSWQP